MIQTVIFDMDGVIVDTEPVHHYAYHQHFKQLNIEVSDELYASFTGNSTRNIFQKLKEQFSLVEEVEDLIKDLHANGIQLIVASSASKVTINRVFTRFNLHQYFTHIVSGEDFPKSKPHPAIFEHAASLSVAPKENCIVIEDSTNGIQAAVSAGIFCVGYNSFHSKNQDLSKANVVIQHFNELNFEKVRDLN